ncbi:MAG: type I-B CRISPR-associated protein Cas7/Cst2/DevR [Candidatus Bathyarchaeia archaeon]
MSKVVLVTGLVLIDAPASALNNAGIEPGRWAENKVVVKKIRLHGREEYPYVSGQAFKRWWRSTLHNRFGWFESPITREEKVAYTEANPVKYEEDDVFGYMLAPAKKEEKVLVYRRVAPLKCTPLLSIFSNVITDDFGVFSRGPAESEPVPFEQEFYSTILKGAFSLMASEIGVLQRGIGKDVPAESTIEKKSTVANEKIKALLNLAKEKNATIEAGQVILHENERKKRIKETLLALSELTGGAKESTYLTEISPKFVIAAVLNVANHIFMDSVKVADGKVVIDNDVLTELVRDYEKNFLSPVFIGLRKGFLEDSQYELISNLNLNLNWVENLDETLRSDARLLYPSPTPSTVFGTPKEAITKLAEHTIRVCI